MTYVDVSAFSRGPLVAGQAVDVINRIFGSLGQVRGADSIEGAGYSTLSGLRAQEKNLREVQDSISKISMHLPKGFASGLNRQFANLFDEDAWEEEDELIGHKAASAFSQFLIATGTNTRPGIGTDGRGSITASWSAGKNRLIVECLPTGKVSLIVSRDGQKGEIERIASGPLNLERATKMLNSFDPGVWFDG